MLKQDKGFLLFVRWDENKLEKNDFGINNWIDNNTSFNNNNLFFITKNDGIKSEWNVRRGEFVYISNLTFSNRWPLSCFGSIVLVCNILDRKINKKNLNNFPLK